jgi:uncharacterized membrane protein
VAELWFPRACGKTTLYVLELGAAKAHRTARERRSRRSGGGEGGDRRRCVGEMVGEWREGVATDAGVVGGYLGTGRDGSRWRGDKTARDMDHPWPWAVGAVAVPVVTPW